MAQDGMRGYQQGYIADQTQLLQIAIDSLGIYNKTVDPIVMDFTRPEIRETARVPQAPMVANPYSDGATPESQRMQFRKVTLPFKDYEISHAFTVLGLRDALPTDVQATMNGVFAGDVDRLMTEFFRRIFVPHSAANTNVDTAQEYGFYNGETNVPFFGNNTFSSAHSHYAGTNNATFALSMVQGAVQDIREHGYGNGEGSLVAFFHTAQLDDVENLLNITASSGLNTPQRVKAQDRGAYGTGLVYGGVEYVFNNWVPSGYFAVIDRTVKPLALREHPNGDYRGLMPFDINANSSFPLSGARFLHSYGFGVVLPGAGAVRQIVASTSYSTPTFRLSA